MEDRRIFVSREDLYEMVWATPVQKLVKEFSMSDVGLAKNCKKLGVPKPPRGYWARLAAGQHPKRPVLPNRLPSQPAGIILYRRDPDSKPIELNQETLDALAALNQPENEITIPESLLKPHPFVCSTKRLIRRPEPLVYGSTSTPWRAGWLDIRVSKGSLNRALLIMDALLKKLESIGFQVVNPTEGSIRTLIIKNNSELEIKIQERYKRYENVLTERQKLNSWKYDKYRLEPTGELHFTLARWPLNQRHWKDAVKYRIEERLTDIVREIVYSAELVRLKNVQREAERLQRLENQRLAEEQRQRTIEENRRREDLENQAISWRRAEDLRRFIQARETEFRSRDKPIKPASSFAAWLAWGRAHANRIDPFTNGWLIHERSLNEVGESREPINNQRPLD